MNLTRSNNKKRNAMTITVALLLTIIALLFAAGCFYLAWEIIEAFKKRFPDQALPPHCYTNQVVVVSTTNGGFTCEPGDVWTGARSE
jgi:hypothetical protein